MNRTATVPITEQADRLVGADRVLAVLDELAPHPVGIALEAIARAVGSTKRTEPRAQCSKRRAGGADLVKIACSLGGMDDFRVLMAFTADHAAEGVITVGMGEWGPLSRLTSPALGSLLSYGFTGEETAPGQLSVQDLASEFERLYPV